MNAVVVIPVYKDKLSAPEQISLRRCQQTLRAYPIVVVGPESMDYSAYRAILDEFSLMVLPEKHFLSVASYNKLLCSRGFYSRFLDWEYMLVHQTDCYVFKDELAHWCAQNYDYVGAPWITFNSLFDRHLWVRQIPLVHRVLNKVGNGGFSLRRVKRFHELAGVIGPIENFSRRHEDLVWANGPRFLLQRFNIPNTEVALEFAFDEAPSVCYQLNRKNLPFGCHGWYRQELEFWLRFLSPSEVASLKSVTRTR